MTTPVVGQRLFDATVAVLIGAVGVVEIWLPLPSVMGDGSRAAATVGVVLVAVALAFRRVWPLRSPWWCCSVCVSASPPRRR
jgi:hypothetical protein